MLIRTLGIFIVMGIIAAIASRLSGIPVLDIVLLSAMLSPLALLQKGLHEEKQDFGYYCRSYSVKICPQIRSETWTKALLGYAHFPRLGKLLPHEQFYFPL